MSLRPFVLPIFVVSALVLSVAAASRLRRPAQPPSSLTELVELLSEAQPDLNIVPIFRECAEGGVYLCVSPCSLSQLLVLQRTVEGVGKWKGVVYCEHRGWQTEIPLDVLEDWGENCMQVGPLLYFGDPALLHHLEATLRQAQRR